MDINENIIPETIPIKSDLEGFDIMPDVKFVNHTEASKQASTVIDMGDQVDSKAKGAYASKKSVAEGMMDIALLTANANQLRFLITYNRESQTYYVSVALIVISLILQIAVGIALIFKRQMKIKGKKQRADRTTDFLVVGVFLVTVINVFAASFTMTDSPSSDKAISNGNGT